jgi:hypothetical protein
MIRDIDNDSERNGNGDDSSIGGDSEWHKHVSNWWWVKQHTADK